MEACAFSLETRIRLVADFQVLKFPALNESFNSQVEQGHLRVLQQLQGQQGFAFKRNRHKNVVVIGTGDNIAANSFLR